MSNIFIKMKDALAKLKRLYATEAGNNFDYHHSPAPTAATIRTRAIKRTNQLMERTTW